MDFDKLTQLCDSDFSQDMQHFHHPSRSLPVPLVVLIFCRRQLVCPSGHWPGLILRYCFWQEVRSSWSLLEAISWLLVPGVTSAPGTHWPPQQTHKGREQPRLATPSASLPALLVCVSRMHQAGSCLSSRGVDDASFVVCSVQVSFYRENRSCLTLCAS